MLLNCQHNQVTSRSLLYGAFGLLIAMSVAACGGGAEATGNGSSSTPPSSGSPAPSPAPSPGSPTASITSPTSSSSYTAPNSTVSLSGTASDDVGVTRVTWSNNRGGSGTASGTSSWSASSISLSTGSNVITVTASDAAGNTGTTTLTVTYNTGSVSVSNAYIRAAALAYGRSPTYSSAECTEMGKRFGVILGSASQVCGSVIKAANPNVILLSYVNTSNFTQDDSLYQYAQSHGGADMFSLNALTTAVQSIDGQTINLAAGDRVWSYRQGNRWQTDYSTPTARQRLVNYMQDEVTKLRANGWSGFFIDNEDRGCGYSGTLVSGSAEGGFVGSVSLESGLLMETNCNAMKLMLDQQIASDLYLVHNTGNYGTRTLHDAPWFWQIGVTQVNSTPLTKEYAAAFVVARGALQEFRYSFTNLLGDLEDNYGGLYEIWTKKGSPANNLYIMWWLYAGNGSDVATNSDRVKMFALGTHLLYQWSRSYIHYDGSNYNDQPLTGDWIGAMGAPIGNASGDKSAVDSHTYRRNFQNGVVLVRFRTSSGDNYTDSGVYNLGGNYYPVDANGNISSTAVTSVTLRNSETFIGVLSATYP